SADFVVAGPAARLRFPEVVIGHAPTGGITARLPVMVGLTRAKELLLTGRWVDAEEGLRLGLYMEVVDDPRERALEFAGTLASHPQRSQAAVKRAIEFASVAQQETYLQLEVEMA
ncbi:enoyl-CoA hydratase/isomerase family protein, partial [Mycobacterium kansasii]